MTDRLLSAALECIPQLEAPQEARESPQTVEEEPERAGPTLLREGLRRAYRGHGGGGCLGVRGHAELST